ncbi:MAG: recombinase family protein [Solirubrobacteraceae bacterium]
MAGAWIEPEAIDTATPAGRLQLHLFAALAQFEAELGRERTRAGLEAARSRGRVGGRPPVLTSEKLDAARLMLADGRTVTATAKALGVHHATLYHHLSAVNATAEEPGA